MRSIALLLAAFCVTAASALADFSLIHEATYAIPGVTPPLKSINYADVDRDGTTDLLVVDSMHMFIYSPNANSILFSRSLDSASSGMTLLFSDVTRDSFPDIVMITASIDSIQYGSTPLHWTITALDGQSHFVDSVTSSFDATVDAGNPFVPMGSAAFLHAVDINSDGFNELILSYSSSSYTCLTACWGSLDGTTLLYHSFPDSVVQALPFLTLGSAPTFADDGSPLLLLWKYSAEFQELGNDYSLRRSTTVTRSLDGSTRTVLSTPFWPGCGEVMRDDALVADAVLGAGDLSTASPGQEVLAMHGAISDCPQADSSQMVSQFRLYDLLRPDSLVELWSLNITDSTYRLRNYLYHPALPGYFFAFSSGMDTLYLFDGHNGSIRYGITDIPVGTKHWETTWPDSQPRLIAQNGTSLSIYKLDIATDINDPTNADSHSIPASFTLGAPYPNPFNAELRIPLTLSRKSQVTVELFNLLGQPVATLIDRELPAGETTLAWRAQSYASGIYFIRATAANKTQARKLLLLK